jgi:hypothetical protein
MILQILIKLVLSCCLFQLQDIGAETRDFDCRNGGRVYWVEYMKPPTFEGSEWSPCASSWAQGEWIDTGYNGAAS